MAKGGAALGSKNYTLVTVDDLTGGVDLRRSPSLLQTTRARTLRNVSLQEPGAWQPYPGWRTFSTTSLGAGRPQGGRRIYLATGTFNLASYGNSVYRPSDAGVWGAPSLTGRGPGQHYFVYDRNVVALFDGVAPLQKTVDGTTWSPFGITAPAAAPGLAAVAGGTLVATNEYEVAYTYSDDALSAESKGSPTAKLTVTGTNLTIRVTVTKSTDAQVDKIYIYARNLTAGESVLRRAGSVSNAGAPGTTTFDITAPTLFFPDGQEIPTRHDLPKAMTFGVVWRNRWWGLSATVGNRIHFTEVFLPQAWPDLYYVDIPFEKGDSITGLIAMGDTLVVFGNTGIFLIIGQTSLDFEVRPSAGAVAGSLGLRAVFVIEQGIVHAAEGGVYIFDGATDRLLSDAIVTAWRNTMETSSPENLQLIAVCYHERRKEVRVSVPRLFETTGPGEWVLDLSRTREQETEAWTSTDRAIGGYMPWDGREAIAGDQGRLLTWKILQGELAEEAVGTTADGGDMVATYEGPALLAAPRRSTRYIDLFGEYGPAPGTFAVEVRVDDVPVTNLAFDIGAAVSLYGTAVYGTSLYGGRLRRNFTSMLPLSSEGLTLSLRAVYVGQSLFRWFTYAVGHRPEPQLRGFD